MNTFFRISIFICMIILTFSLVASFIDAMDVFPVEQENPGVDISSTDSALSALTGLDDPNMNSIWLGVSTLAFLGAVTLCFLTKQVTPLGLFLYGEVFWTAWIRTSSVLSYGGYVPGEFLLVFTVGVMMVFIASIIGMLTGSG